MNKTLTFNQKVAVRSKAAAIGAAITVTIATLYFLATMYTPELSFTQGSWFGFRIGNALRALTAVTPFAGLGIGLGSVYNGIATGKLITGIHWLTPIAIAALGYVTYKLAQYGPKKGIMYHVKLIVLLSVQAAIMAILVRFNHTVLKFALASFLTSEAQAFLWIGMAGKVISGIAATLVGYPLIGLWNIVRDKIEKPVN